MILKRLEMTAFGPFKDTEVIDFEKLSNNKIFLIYGKTGSGKSTIFDAISYALYGEMTGNYRKSSSIKSTYASNDSICSVTLFFEEKGVTYKVERTPKQQIYSNRTKKNIEKNSNATLYIVQNDGSLKNITNKTTDVTPKIVEIIGINHSQFTQVVVLPQGQFIDILNKKGTEREDLLNALLRTDKYNYLTIKIKEAYDKLHLQISDVNSRIKGLLEQFNVSTKEELFELLKKIEPEYQEKEKLFNNTSSKVLSLTKEIERINQNNRYLELYYKEKENIDKLKEDEERINSLIGNIELINKLEKITPIYSSLKNKQDNITLTKNQIENINREYIENKPLFDNLSSLEEKINSENKEYLLLNGKLQALKALKDNYDSIEELTKEIQDQRNKKILLFSNKTRDEEIITILENEKDGLEKEIKEYQDYINSNSLLEVELEKRKALIEGYNIYKNDERDYKNLLQKIQSYKIDLEKENNIYSELNSNYLNQEKIYNHNELFKYHDLLKDDTPCPLCGSKHHPDIIKLFEGAVSKESLDLLKVNVEEKKHSIIHLNAKIENEEKNLRVIENKLEESKFSTVDINQVNQEIGKLNDDLEKKSDYQKRLKNTQEQLKSKENELNIKKQKFNENSIELSKIEGKIETLKNTLNDTRKLIIDHVENVDNYPVYLKDVETKTQQLNTSITENQKEFDKLSNKKKTLETSINVNKENLERLIKEKDSITTLLDSSLEEQKLSLDLYLQYNQEMTPKKSQFEKEVALYKNNLDNSYKQMETYSKLIYQFEFVDVKDKQEELSILKNELDNIQNEFTNSKGLYTSIYSNYESIEKYEKSVENDLKRHNILERLFNLCTGKITGVQKMSLSKFVLSKLLDDMIIYANKYYSKFSLGRYKLVRNESLEVSNSGLDLDIIDSLTSSTRPVSSLSGGESFMAALALSLGMSECISSLIGGININMVFIDEGFGTLDDEHLDQALETLTSLSSGGLMIGIISHIDELKNRIESKVEVVKTSYGSYIK